VSTMLNMFHPAGRRHVWRTHSFFFFKHGFYLASRQYRDVDRGRFFFLVFSL